MFKKIIIWLSLDILPLTAFAQTGTAPITNVQQLLNLMCNIFGWMFYGLMALSLIMGLVAGYNYVTGGDNPEKVSKASKMILYAVIGVAVALIAKGIPNIVADFIGASASNFTKC